MRILLWLGIVALGALVGATVVANYNAARERPGTRACPANQASLGGAVEMYNLDKNTKLVKDPHPACVPLTDEIVSELKKHGYILSEPRCPQGEGKQIYHLVTWHRGVFCMVHGDHSPESPMGMSAREQLRKRGITDPALLAAARADPAPGYEGGLTPLQSKLVIALVAILAGLAFAGLLRG